MEKRINLVEILKDCPRGMELDCVLFDDVKFEECAGDCIYIRLNNGGVFALTKYGNCLEFPISKCVIFPKDKTTWEGFRPTVNFKDGDVVSTEDGSWIGITTGGKSSRLVPTYCVLTNKNVFEVYFDIKENWHFDRLATEEEKEKLFNRMKDSGFKWNPETKTLEKLIIPKFKVGDRIANDDYVVEITEIDSEEEVYIYESKVSSIGYILFSEQDNWELVPDKFDVTTLKPFDKVLVRLTNNCVWMPKLFSHYDPKVKYYPFVTIENLGYPQCIPYNGNEHLCRTANNCDEFYRVWEK